MGFDSSGGKPTPVFASEPGNNRSPALRFLFEFVQTIVLALVFYFLIDAVVARVRVENISMKPTVNPGEYLLVNKLAYRLGDMKHGDVVVFHNPFNPSEDYIKRIIGLPGDVVKIRHGKISVNGQEIMENYPASKPEYDGDWSVPAGSLFVLGDNRNQSSDSHAWGFIPVDSVVGKALAIYWPPNEIKSLTQPAWVNAAN